MCEGVTCGRDHRCTGQHCFSSLTTVDGAAVQQKGCLRDDQEGRATCATPPSPARVVKCCQGHLCNMNVTVQAPGKGDFVHTLLFYKRELPEFAATETRIPSVSDPAFPNASLIRSYICIAIFCPKHCFSLSYFKERLL